MIYFAQPVDGGPIKIGHSNQVEARLKTLRFYYGRRLRLLATMPGGYEEEQTIHRRFAHLRLGKRFRRRLRVEQFRPAADLMAFIGCPPIEGLDPDAVEAMRPKNNRVVLFCLTGTVREREYLQAVSKETGVPLSEIARRGIVLWARVHTPDLKLPPDWIDETAKPPKA